ncbi:MAG: hypothetical protein FWE15_00110 [Actinomycetia bacterium]|nr:hypothetical protein [Actinomycetes bacterium]
MAAREVTRDSLRSSVGGAGGGTGLVLIAQGIGLNTTGGKALVYISPFATVLIGSILFFAEIQLDRLLQRRAVRSAQITITEQLDNPRTSNEHKDRLRKKLESLEESWAADQITRAKITYASPRRSGRS